MAVIAFPILVASSVIVGFLGLWRGIAALAAGDGRRLKERLRRSVGSEAQVAIAKSIRRRTGLDEVKGVLGKYELFHNINRTLLQSAPHLTLNKFLTHVLAAGFGTLFVVFLITGAFVVSFVAALLGGSVPFLMLMSKRNKRQRLISDQLPDALDFMGRSLRAGHSMITAFQMMSEELPEPISGEFRRVFEQHSLGASLEDALRAAVDRVESVDFAFFVTSALIQRQTGGDLSEVLNNITGMIRARVRLQQHVKAKTAEGRFTGYILAAFPAVMFVLLNVLNPSYMGAMLEETVGKCMLAGAFSMQLTGLYVIHKLTIVRV